MAPEAEPLNVVDDMITEIQDAIDLEGAVGAVDLTDDMEDEPVDLRADGITKSPKPKHFKGSTPPTKVANLHVKQTPQENKDQKAKEKNLE